MKKNKSVKPLHKYAEPAYPTLVEIGRADLSRIPARWQGLRVVASSIGAAAMSLKALALEADAVVPSVPATPLAVVPDAEAPKETTARPVTEVCPLPAKEIAGDGAGAFGCVAMNPPHILPEGEALDFIAREFAKRGVVLRDCPVLEDVEMPVREWKPTLEEFAVAQKKAEAVGASVRAPRERRRMMLDFGTADGSLMVEYVSSSDERQWNFDPWRGAFTAWGYDMRGAAEDVVKGLRARTEGRPVTVGVFYDPCACLPKGWKPTYPEGMTEDDRGAWEVRRKQAIAKSTELAREKLIAQIEHFFKYLEKHPVK